MVQLLTNLVKLTDYPFAYSIIGLLLSMSRHGINLGSLDYSTLGPLITLIALFATALSITDPFGNLLRFIITRRTSHLRMDQANQPYIFKRAALTNWISFEIDKIVSMIYFLIILIFILIALNNQPFLDNIFISFGFSQNSTCPDGQCNGIIANQSSDSSRNLSDVIEGPQQFLTSDNIRFILQVILIISIIGMSISIFFAVTRRLTDCNQMVAYYFESSLDTSGLTQDQRQTVKTLQDGFEQSLKSRDWGMAAYYAMQIGEIMRLYVRNQQRNP